MKRTEDGVLLAVGYVAIESVQRVSCELRRLMRMQASNTHL